MHENPYSSPRTENTLRPPRVAKGFPHDANWRDTAAMLVSGIPVGVALELGNAPTWLTSVSIVCSVTAGVALRRWLLPDR